MDVDIDFPSDFDPLDYFEQATRASQVYKGKDGDTLKKHPAGVYFQKIPKDKMTGLSAIPYKNAEELGYFKIDFLHLNILDNFESKEQIRALLKCEPDWFLLQSAGVVSKLFQLHQHYDLLSKVKPTSVQEIADCIALIRPGKKHLQDAYLKNRDLIRQELYKNPNNGKAYYKKPHAVAYALTIVLQLHLIKGKII